MTRYDDLRRMREAGFAAEKKQRAGSVTINAPAATAPVTINPPAVTAKRGRGRPKTGRIPLAPPTSVSLGAPLDNRRFGLGAARVPCELRPYAA
jgi:hypothetical protein